MNPTTPIPQLNAVTLTLPTDRLTGLAPKSKAGAPLPNPPTGTNPNTENRSGKEKALHVLAVPVFLVCFFSVIKVGLFGTFWAAVPTSTGSVFEIASLVFSFWVSIRGIVQFWNQPGTRTFYVIALAIVAVSLTLMFVEVFADYANGEFDLADARRGFNMIVRDFVRLFN